MKTKIKLLSLLLCTFIVLQCFAIIPLSAEAEEIEVEEDYHSCCNGHLGSCVNSELETETEFSLYSSMDDVNISMDSSEVVSSILSADLSSLAEDLSDSEIDSEDIESVFNSSSLFDIANWYYEQGVISEREKILCYCDLITDRNFQNVYCLNPIVAEVSSYYNELNDTLSELSNDIAFALNSLSNTGSITNTSAQAQGLSSTLSSNTDEVHTYESNNFTFNLYGVSSLQWGLSERSAIIDLSELFEEARAYYHNLNYNYPLLGSGTKYVVDVYPTAYTDDQRIAAYTSLLNESKTTATKIFIYNFSSDNFDDCPSMYGNIVFHEYFHAIQCSYNSTDSWLIEAAATWAQIKRFGLSSQYMQSTLANSGANAYLILSSIYNSTIYSNDGGYSAAIFPMSLDVEFGSDIIRQIYVKLNQYEYGYSNVDLVDCIDEVLEDEESSFIGAYKQMVVSINNARDYFSQFGGGSLLPEFRNIPLTHWTDPTYNGNTSIVSGTLDPLSSEHFAIYLGEETRYSKSIVEVCVTFSNNDGCVYEYIEYATGSNLTDTPEYLDSTTPRVVRFTKLQSSSDTDWIYFGFCNTGVASNATLTYTVNVSIVPVYECAGNYYQTTTLDEESYVWYEYTLPTHGVCEITGMSEEFAMYGMITTELAISSPSRNTIIDSDSDGESGFYMEYQGDYGDKIYIRVSGYDSCEYGEFYIQIVFTDSGHTYECECSDKTQHRYICDCGYVLKYEAHSFSTTGAKKVCTLCGYIGTNTTIEPYQNKNSELK